MLTPRKVLIAEVVTAVAEQAGVTVDAMRTGGAPRSATVQARQRAAMLARALRPDRSWVQLCEALGMTLVGAYEAAGAASVRCRRGDAAELEAVEEICREILGVPVPDLNLPSPQRRHLTRALRQARRRAAAAEKAAERAQANREQWAARVQALAHELEQPGGAS